MSEKVFRLYSFTVIKLHDSKAFSNHHRDHDVWSSGLGISPQVGKSPGAVPLGFQPPSGLYQDLETNNAVSLVKMELLGDVYVYLCTNRLITAPNNNCTYKSWNVQRPVQASRYCCDEKSEKIIENQAGCTCRFATSPGQCIAVSTTAQANYW